MNVIKPYLDWSSALAARRVVPQREKREKAEDQAPAPAGDCSSRRRGRRQGGVGGPSMEEGKQRGTGFLGASWREKRESANGRRGQRMTRRTTHERRSERMKECLTD
jgi:hypothetical protein